MAAAQEGRRPLRAGSFPKRARGYASVLQAAAGVPGETPELTIGGRQPEAPIHGKQLAVPLRDFLPWPRSHPISLLYSPHLILPISAPL